MKPRHIILAAIAAAAGGISSVHAAPSDGPWNVALYLGDTFSSTGALRSSRQVTIANPATLDPNLAGAPATLALRKLDYDKIYNDSFAAGLELGYTRDENLDFFGRVNYTKRRGRTRDIGTLTSTRLAAAQPLVAHFDDSDSQSLSFGARYFWMKEATWRPYIAAALGATFTDRMRASLSVKNTAINLKDVRFARRETGFSQSAEVGVEYNPNSRLGLRLSVGADHVGKPSRDADPALTALGFNFGEHVDSRTSFPVAVAMVYRFE